MLTFLRFLPVEVSYKKGRKLACLDAEWKKDMMRGGGKDAILTAFKRLKPGKQGGAIVYPYKEKVTISPQGYRGDTRRPEEGNS